jgi:hypothetical protein
MGYHGYEIHSMAEKKTSANSLQAFETANALASKYLQNPQSIVVYV